MGYYARVSADPAGLTEHDAAQLAQDAPILNTAPSTAVSGYAWRNGRAIPFTLEANAMTSRMDHVLPERMIMAALMLVSFAAPIFHLLG